MILDSASRAIGAYLFFSKKSATTPCPFCSYTIFRRKRGGGRRILQRQEKGRAVQRPFRMVNGTISVHVESISARPSSNANRITNQTTNTYRYSSSSIHLTGTTNTNEGILVYPSSCLQVDSTVLRFP